MAMNKPSLVELLSKHPYTDFHVSIDKYGKKTKRAEVYLISNNTNELIGTYAILYINKIWKEIYGFNTTIHIQ